MLNQVCCKWGWNCRNCHGEDETVNGKAEASTDDDDTSHEDARNDDDAAEDNSSDEYHNGQLQNMQHPLVQLNELYEYEPAIVYSMKLLPEHNDYGDIDYIEEVDNLPDPRIYNVDVELLNIYVLLFMAHPERLHPIHQYEQYMRHVDPLKRDYQVAVDWAWEVLHSEAPKHKSTPSLLSEPLLILKYLPPILSNDTHERSRQIMIAMVRYVRQIEPHFHQHLDKAYRDNVEWDYFTKSPTPKESFLRWCRWKCYFVNRYHRYQDRENLDELSPLDDRPEGPPNWRDVDELRAQRRNWFIMNSVTSQYKKVTCGFQDEFIPQDDYFDLKDIVFWEQIPLWKRGPHSNFLPLTRIWNNCARDPVAEHLSHRHTHV
jgi:hypothetical protein